MRLFHKDWDYRAFEKALSEAIERYPVDLLTYCLMPNHWHLLLRPRTEAALSNMTRWLGVTHVRRHHAHYHNEGGGHLYQGRFKSFPVQDDRHFLTVARYVEANPVRGKCCRDADSWPWSGRWAREKRDKPFALSSWPVNRPSDWLALLNEPLAETDLKLLQTSAVKGRPFGEESWVQSTARRLGLLPTLRDRGRPRKTINE